MEKSCNKKGGYQEKTRYQILKRVATKPGAVQVCAGSPAGWQNAAAFAAKLCSAGSRGKTLLVMCEHCLLGSPCNVLALCYITVSKACVSTGCICCYVTCPSSPPSGVHAARGDPTSGNSSHAVSDLAFTVNYCCLIYQRLC